MIDFLKRANKEDNEASSADRGSTKFMGHNLELKKVGTVSL
jgi:hypothetical protein